MNIAPTGLQTATQSEVDAFLRAAREAPNSESPRVLAIDQIPLMRAKKGGYPIHMYHESLEMRIAMKPAEETALAMAGYQRPYIHKVYPKALYRRNMDARYEPVIDDVSGIQQNNGFVQTITARDAQHEKELRAMKPKHGQSAWFERLEELPQLDDGPIEDPAVTIARLQGEVDGLKSAKGSKAA